MREVVNLVRLDAWLAVRAIAVVVVWSPFWILFRGSKRASDYVFALSLILLVMMMGAFYGGFLAEGMKGHDLLYDTLPLRRGAVIVSHFLVSSVIVIISEAMLVVTFLVENFVGVDLADDWWLDFVVLAGILLLTYAIVVPAMIRFGAGKGVVVFVGVAAVMALGSYFLLQLISPILAWIQEWLPFLFLASSLLLYVGSLPVSIRLYERRDH